MYQRPPDVLLMVVGCREVLTVHPLPDHRAGATGSSLLHQLCKRRFIVRRIILSVTAVAALMLTVPLAAEVASARVGGSAAASAKRPGKPVAPPRVRGKVPHHLLAHSTLCATTPLTADWRNIDPNTRAMSRVTVDFYCSDVVLCDTSGHCTGGDSAYYMHPYGRCHPSDCDWGRQRATEMGGDWVESTYNFGFKTSYVWLKTYSYYGRTYLRVWVYNQFSPSDGRASYTTDEWFLP